MSFWEWFELIGGFIGFVAFLMAVQPFTEAIWGNPCIEITPNQFVSNGKKILCFDLSNKFISKGILQKLRIWRRTAEGLCVDFYIYDSNGKPIIEEIGAELEMSGLKQRQISLPASITWATVIFAETSPDGSSFVSTIPDLTSIFTGSYKVLIAVRYESKLIRHQYLFTIGDKPDGTCWVNQK